MPLGRPLLKNVKNEMMDRLSPPRLKPALRSYLTKLKGNHCHGFPVEPPHRESRTAGERARVTPESPGTATKRQRRESKQEAKVRNTKSSPSIAMGTLIEWEDGILNVLQPTELDISMRT
jgi:hypothetical protein